MPSPSKSRKLKGPRPCKQNANPKTSYNDGLGQTIVDIYVGPEEQLFRIHKTRLCRRIGYFNKMFNGGFKEAIENVARLPEEDPALFDVLAEWVYSPNPYKTSELVKVVDSTNSLVASWDALGFYNLAEKFCLPQLQDAIMDSFITYQAKNDELPSIEFVRRVYETTKVGSSMSRYVMHTTCYILNVGQVDGWPTCNMVTLFQEIPAFASDYINFVRDRRAVEVPDPRNLQSCAFHIHSMGSPCFNIT